MDAGHQHHLRVDFQGGPRGRLHRANSLTPQSVNLILKKRCRMAGLDPADFSAHGLRSGFMTQAGRDGIPLVDAMRQSADKSVQQAAGYYDEQEHAQSLSVRIDI
jgi:integrase